jgi:hypothetical protein
MSECFRRLIIKFFLKKELMSAWIATSLINWRHKGFSVHASVRIPAFSDQAREALSQYIARPPLSLKKISIKENREATVISFTSDSEFFKGNTESLPVMGFFLELTQHIPPKAASMSGATACMPPTARASGRTRPMCYGWLLRGGKRNISRMFKTCNPTMQKQPTAFLTKKAGRRGRG